MDQAIEATVSPSHEDLHATSTTDDNVAEGVHAEKTAALADADYTDATVISHSYSGESQTSADHAAAAVEAVLAIQPASTTDVAGVTVTNEGKESTELRLCDTTEDQSMPTVLCCVQQQSSLDGSNHGQKAPLLNVSSSSLPVKSCQINDATDPGEDDRESIFMFPQSNIVTKWTEDTRRRFELSIESLLSTVDSTGRRNSRSCCSSSSSGDEEQMKTATDSTVLSTAYEGKYRSMVKTGLANLEKDEKMHDDGNAQPPEEQNKCGSNNNMEQNGDDEDGQASAMDPLTRARRTFSPLDRSARLRRMRRSMSHHSDRDESKGGRLHNATTSKTATTTMAKSPHHHDLSGNKGAQSFDDDYVRRRSFITQSPKGTATSSGGNGGDSSDTNVMSNNSNSDANSSENVLARYFQQACMCGDSKGLVPVEEEEDIVTPINTDKALFVSDDDELHGYDSDPELFHAASSSSFGVEVRGQTNKNADEGEVPGSQSSANRTKLPRFINLRDEGATSKLIDEIVHDTIILVWHKSVDLSQGSRTSAPTSQRMWVELGCRVKGQIIQPRLVWRSAHHKQQGKGESSLPSPTTSAGIDILDISRVRSLSDAERRQYPLAKKSRSFTIITSDKMTYIFEAKNTQEKARIVLSLKLLVARLASLIIVGDEKLFEDFFYPDSCADFHRTYDMGMKRASRRSRYSRSRSGSSTDSSNSFVSSDSLRQTT